MRWNRFWLCCCIVLACNGCGSVRELPATADTGIRYRIHLARGDMQLSGIVLLKSLDGQIRGSVINEFGVKAFDLTAGSRRTRLLHTAGPLDKWYIRRTVGRDLHFWLLHREQPAVSEGPRTLQGSPQDMTLQNRRTGLSYQFNLME